MSNTIAIVGRSNVGKSTLFNRLVNKRIAIVHDTPGVTRDRIYGIAEWQQKEFNVIDTGGISLEKDNFQSQIRIQSQIAIEQANIIIFVLDNLTELSHDDFFIANILKKSKKEILVVVNKTESNNLNSALYKIGFKLFFPISAVHGTGIGDLLDTIVKKIDFKTIKEKKCTKISIIGRPNVGKSSLLNILTNEQRAIVSNIPGTTRDSVESFFYINKEKYKIIDTSGILRKSKLNKSVEIYSLIRSMNSLDESNITILVMDCTKDISNFDSRMIGYALERNKPIILAINKWDLILKDTYTMTNFLNKIKKRFKFAQWIKVVFISALKKKNIDKLKSEILSIKEIMNTKIKTSLLNEILVEAITFKPPKIFRNGTLHIKFVTQIFGKIPTFVFFVNNIKFLHFSYKRYLENQLRDNFNLIGVPIVLKFKAIKK